jgi:exopolysaccharide biosynthesis polyprenyl glycosylphosphotransferase
MKNATKTKQLILLLVDILILYFSLFLTIFLRFGRINAEIWASHFAPFTFIFVIWIIVFYISRLYDLHRSVTNLEFLQATASAAMINGVIAIIYFYTSTKSTISPKTTLLVFIFLFYFLFLLWRYAFNKALISYLPKNNIAIIGLDKQVKELVAELIRKPHLGYHISFIATREENETANNIKIIHDFSLLKEMVIKNKISMLILNSDPRQSSELQQALFSCLPLGIKYFSLPHFYENILGQVPLASLSQMWFLENLNEGDRPWFNWLKRFFDIIFSLGLLLTTAPLWPIIGIIIKLESRGEIFFKQKRLGKNSQPFTMIKFRTMSSEDNDFSPTSAEDKRITRVGSLLRKTRVDELPQVINILLGDMSFIGPRPEQPKLAIELEKVIPFYQERILVKPGVTGWDQVSGEYHSPSVEDSLKKLQYDLFYIKNRSLYLDLSILLKTIATVLGREGR